MKIYLGVTDNDWFNFLSKINPEDVNFWQPGGKTSFRILDQGGPFLFKLKSPINKIGGVGFFSSHSFLPISVAWDVFELRNGCDSLENFKRKIFRYRNNSSEKDPIIGCIVLTNPIFFRMEDWIDIPSNWSDSIVQGKSYETTEIIGGQVWNKISELIEKYLYFGNTENQQELLFEDGTPHYGESILSKVRLGQGAFRILVTDAYQRRCAISNEKTLPVLEAAHIKPYSQSGPHKISNALLLRSDLHKLFDTGYITISKELKVEVSKRIKEQYENGKEYYKFHGAELINKPILDSNTPNSIYLEWHNENIFQG